MLLDDFGAIAKNLRDDSRTGPVGEKICSEGVTEFVRVPWHTSAFQELVQSPALTSDYGGELGRAGPEVVFGRFDFFESQEEGGWKRKPDGGLALLGDDLQFSVLDVLLAKADGVRDSEAGVLKNENERPHDWPTNGRVDFLQLLIGKNGNIRRCKLGILKGLSR